MILAMFLRLAAKKRLATIRACEQTKRGHLSLGFLLKQRIFLAFGMLFQKVFCHSSTPPKMVGMHYGLIAYKSNKSILPRGQRPWQQF
jgi:hypothetical protein